MRYSRTVKETILIASAVPGLAVVDNVASVIVHVKSVPKITCAVAETRSVVDAVVVAPAIASIAIVV